MANLYKEHRKFLRFPVSIPVKLKDSSEDISTVCSNISQKGIYIETAERLKKGDLLCLNLSLKPKTHPVKILGEVRWTVKTDTKDYSDKKLKGFGIKILANMKDNLNIKEGILEKERWKPSPEKDTSEFSSLDIKNII